MMSAPTPFPVGLLRQAEIQEIEQAIQQQREAAEKANDELKKSETGENS